MRPALTFLLGSLTVSTIACGPRYRVEPVGSGVAQLRATAVEPEVAAAVAAPGSGEVTIREAGLHRVSVQLRLPHALRVHYEVHCPGTITAIDDGETMEAYRTRRLAELEREREQQKRTAGALTGAVLGTVGGAAGVETPTSSTRVEAEVDGAVVGEAVAESAIPQVELDPRDVGARVITARHEVHADGAGRCALLVSGATPEDDASGVTGTFSVERVIDIKAEQHQARVEARKRAVTVRGDLTATLVARGADPHKRARERAAAKAERERVRQLEVRAELAARAERDRARQVQVRAELTARAEMTARANARLDAAMATRSYVVAWLGRCGGDPYKRQRERAELRRQEQLREALLRRQREARVRVTMEARGSLRANLIALGADPEFRRKQFEAETAAYEARAEAQRRAERARAVRADAEAELEAELGTSAELEASVEFETTGVARPPRPAARVETRPPMPTSGAVWIAGWFEWSGVEWQWRPGRWTVPPQRGAVWVAPVEVIIRGTTVLRPGGWVDKSNKPVVRDHRKKR